MAKLINIVKFLNKELKIKSIKDSSQNGLQVNCKKEINKIGFAVDSSLAVLDKAKKAKVDMLIVHHGIIWKPLKYKDLITKKIAFLKKNKISFYGAHLPLDAHYNYGNNIELCRILGLIKTKKFGNYHGQPIGYSGEFKKSKTMDQISKVLNKKLHTRCKIFAFGKTKIKSIGIVSGGGSDCLPDAVKQKKDCFLTGETGLGAYNRAQDYKMSMIVAGHYATETLGVKALMPVLSERFKVKTIFIENNAI